MVGGHVMKRIPRIKFPQRHPKSSSSDPGIMSGHPDLRKIFHGSASQAQDALSDGEAHLFFVSRSDVPAAPKNTAVGGKASLQPKRTPVSDREIEAIMQQQQITRKTELLPAFGDGPDHQRLPTSAIPGSKYTFHTGHEAAIVCLQVGPIVFLQPQLVRDCLKMIGR
ncbi:hypothetical protein RJ641_033735 [Dillenia turbinata]|uniref:Uncharacterized protein n=1 Tax=Dillenia turbinata TaxID=194707 RepID=A0AAN8ZJP8_9MAGN